MQANSKEEQKTTEFITRGTLQSRPSEPDALNRIGRRDSGGVGNSVRIVLYDADEVALLVALAMCEFRKGRSKVQASTDYKIGVDTI